MRMIDSLGNTLTIGDRYIHKNSTGPYHLYELTEEGTCVYFHDSYSQRYEFKCRLTNHSINVWTIKYPSELPITKEAITMFRAMCGWNVT